MRRGAAIVTCLCLVLAACSKSKGKPQAGPSGATPPAVRIGLLYTVSGQGGEFAQAALGTAQLVQEDLKKDGVNVQIDSEDYGGNAQTALRKAQALADKGDVGIVVATDDPKVAGTLGDFHAAPLMYALLSEDKAVEGNPDAFRNTPSNRLQADKLARFLVEHRGYEKIAILHDDTAFGVEGGQDLEASFADEGADVVLNASFKPGGDVHTLVSNAGQLQAQVLVVWAASAAEAGRITIDVQRSAESYQLVLSGNLATASYGKNASSQVVPVAFRDGILSVGTWAGPWFDELPKIDDFFSRFKTAQNALAPVQAIQIYDGLDLLARAADEAPAGSPDAVRDAIEATHDFEGVGVPLSFSARDHEGVGMEDMAIWGFTTDQNAAGGQFFPAVDTGGGYFTIDPVSVTLPSRYSYLLNGLPGA